MESSNGSVPFNSHRVIPPISTSRDKRFLDELNAWIHSELSKVNKESPEQSYQVHKEAFDKLIDQLGVFKPLLIRIKSEYEECINKIRDGQHEAFFLSGKLKEIVNAPMTLQNYKKMTADLESRILSTEEENEKILKELSELELQRISKDSLEKGRSATVSKDSLEKGRSAIGSKDSLDKSRSATKLGRNGVDEPKRTKPRGPVAGWTVNQATDCNLLQRELERLEREFRELSLSYHTRYSSKSLETDLKDRLATSVLSRDQLGEEIERLKHKHQKMSVAVQAAQAYLKIPTPNETIGQSVVAALARDASTNHPDSAVNANQNANTCVTIDDEDVQNENQIEVLLEYIEKFNELLENKMYEEAAIHAANSIKGVLRTPETMQRFKELSMGHKSRPSPLLTFCEALISTVPSYSVRPNESMSEECVRCALTEKRLDLLTHWLSQDRLTVTEKMADMIFEFCARNPQPNMSIYLGLAQKIYTDVLSHVSALVCMVKQGRVKQALDYAERKSCSTKDLTKVLRRCPDLEFAAGLYRFESDSRKRWLPLGVIVTVLFDAALHEDGLQLLQDVYAREVQAFGMDALKNVVANDPLTTHAQWLSIIDRCNRSGSGHLVDLANQLLAAVVVKSAAANAEVHLRSVVEQEQHLSRNPSNQS